MHMGSKLMLGAAALTAALLACAVAQDRTDPWTSADLIQPADLAARLSDSRAPKPEIVHVGFVVLYRSKHIPNSPHLGPAAKPEGLEALRQYAAKLPRDREIVIYCGCCPWDHCPNMRPAFRALRDMGFRNVRALQIPTNFAKDWIDKGYPIEKGQP